MDATSVHLNPGFFGYVSIENDSKQLFKKKIASLQEAREFINKYGKSVPEGSWLRATVIPLRTDSWKDFAEDLFLPTFINHALKVDNIVLKILTSALAIFLDIVTFIPRLIASPFRVIYNNNHKSDHPLTALIQDELECVESIKSRIVKIKVEIDHVTIQKDEVINIRTAKRFMVDGYVIVAIKQLPRIEEESNFDTTSSNYSELAGGEWDQQSSIPITTKYL